ncbi:NAD-dependent protein deacylase [Paenibacillus alkaliterrae]|uniref:NAD-dependent protein deacylase n=1 Tax=Paenibacillus alkaliterrae TaxID=320909 RepID=UPI001F492313|nr:NAD-dependent protein deacylase [Paenibacillus alkaliterrae]MCF2939424.1 NAD-dependent protein deacylase [Paenibacillus alkaliterrae]
MNTFDRIAARIVEAKRITVLTGAGISTASGIPDFRSRGGLYDNGLPMEQLLSRSYFNNNPRRFWHYFKKTFQLDRMSELRPNAGHFFMKELENAGKEVTVLTQNVDGFHRAAGSGHVIEMHGTLMYACCPACKKRYPIKELLEADVPACAADGADLKPDIVLFGEAVRHMEEAYAAVCESDVFIVMGSSLEVYPVNTLPSYTRNAREMTTILINRDTTRMDPLFQYVLNSDINECIDRIKASPYWSLDALK